MRFTTDAHTGNLVKIYRFYYKTCNVWHHVGVPAGKLTITWMVKVDKIIIIYEQVFCLPLSQ